MNSIDLFLKRAQAHPAKTALWLESAGAVSFGELAELAGRAQKLCRAHGVKAGDSVLMVDHLGPRLYASIIGILAMGASVVFVEPWMPVGRIAHALDTVKPRLFITNALGRLWGLRVGAVRDIPKWLSASAIDRESASPLAIESVDAASLGIVTFTSGTTGRPKGVVRNQGYLVEQHRVLESSLGLGDHAGPDLCIFANFVLANLASGRGSVIVSGKWPLGTLSRLDSLPASLRPESLTCGPAFLLRLMEHAKSASLKSIHVGGALTDNWIFETAFNHWPTAHLTHIYGSTEAEPVALSDARTAVRRSREAGYFQTLYLGQPVPDITPSFESESLWITGPHVCREYLGDADENRIHKRRDAEGRVWHRMGDRVAAKSDGLWYGGRSTQTPADFALEQKIYARLDSSAAFLHRTADGALYLVGQKLKGRESELRREFPELTRVIPAKIARDPRHRARIDRPATLKKGAIE